MSSKSAIVVLYSHPECYPPTLNAMEVLAKKFDKITIVHRNVMASSWKYPANVETVTTGQFVHYSKVGRKSPVWKLIGFASFVLLLIRQLRRLKPSWVILYDPIPILAWKYARAFATANVRVWYHNHDVIKGNENFFSRLSYKAQSELFYLFDKFSLPSKERLTYFPKQISGENFFFIPNFPSRKFYDRFYTKREITAEVRLIYQGYISEGHGFEELLPVLQCEVGNNIRVKLVLKGYRDENYLDRLLNQAKQCGVKDRIEVHPVTAYEEVPKVSSTCHIGIGIQTKTDIMTTTLGTASNKIYEYAAVGLPVLLFDSEQFRKHLGQYPWAFFTNCTPADMKEQIDKIISNYSHYSQHARKDFEENLNFEKLFNEAVTDL
jgi:hypothetical protein